MRVSELLQQGAATGEFRDVDPIQFAPSIVAINIHYFIIAPVSRALFNRDPYAPEAIVRGAPPCWTLLPPRSLADREAGVKLAAEIARQRNAEHASDPAPAPVSESEQGQSQ